MACGVSPSDAEFLEPGVDPVGIAGLKPRDDADVVATGVNLDAPRRVSRDEPETLGGQFDVVFLGRSVAGSEIVFGKPDRFAVPIPDGAKSLQGNRIGMRRPDTLRVLKIECEGSAPEQAGRNSYSEERGVKTSFG